MAADVVPNPHSFASVLTNLSRQGYTSPWDDNDDADDLTSPTKPVASYSQHTRSDSQSTSSSQDSFYTLYDEPLEARDGLSESESLPQTPRAENGADISLRRPNEIVVESPHSPPVLSETRPEPITRRSGSMLLVEDDAAQDPPRNSIRVSTTTTIQRTPPGSINSKTTPLPSPTTETFVFGNVARGEPFDKTIIDSTKSLPGPLRSVRRRPSPINIASSPTQSHLSIDFDKVISEEELRKLEAEVTPQARPRTKNLAKVFGQDPKHTYPSPLSSPLPPEVTKRHGEAIEDVKPNKNRACDPETTDSHIGDLRKKLAWRPTALSSAEEEADRRDLAILLGEDDDLVAKIFGDGPEESTTRESSSERQEQHERLIEDASNDDASFPESRRQLKWRSTATSDRDKVADERDLYELMEVAFKAFDDQPGRSEEVPPVGVALTTGQSHTRKLSSPPAIPPRVTSVSASTAVTGHGTHSASQPAGFLLPQVGHSFKNTPLAQTALESETEAGSHAHFSDFSEWLPAARNDLPNGDAARDPRSEENYRARADTSSTLRSIGQLAPCVYPAHDMFCFDEESHQVEPELSGCDSSYSDSTISDISDQASPETTRPESPVSETDGVSDREKQLRTPTLPSTPQASRNDGRVQHQHYPSASTGISTVSDATITTINDSDEEASVISRRDLSQPPAHLFEQSLPSPLASHSPRASTNLPLAHRPQTSPGPVKTVHTLRALRPNTSSKSIQPESPKQSMDSAAPPPIALVRPERASPENSPKQRRRRLGNIRDTILLRRPSQITMLNIARGSSNNLHKQGSMPSPAAPRYQTTSDAQIQSRPSTASRASKDQQRSSSSSEQVPSRVRSRGNDKEQDPNVKTSKDIRRSGSLDLPRILRPNKPTKRAFDEAALNELLCQSVPYEQASQGQTPFLSREAASVYAGHKTRRKPQVPLGLDMLGEWEMSQLLQRQSQNIAGHYMWTGSDNGGSSWSLDPALDFGWGQESLHVDDGVYTSGYGEDGVDGGMLGGFGEPLSAIENKRLSLVVEEH